MPIGAADVIGKGYNVMNRGFPQCVVHATVLLIFAFAIGFAAALAIRVVLFAIAACGHLLWDGLPQVLDARWLPLVICPLGGLVIGLFTKRFGGTPESLQTVIASIRESGAYRTKSMPASLVGFALPLVFGGCVGPEAGLAGIIASACSWVGDTLGRAGMRVRAAADLTVSAVFCAVFGAPLAGVVAGDRASDHVDGEVSLRRTARLVLYAVAASGAFLGVWLFGRLAGAAGGLPRLDAMQAAPSDLPWGLVCLAAAWILALIYSAAHAGFGRLSARIGNRPVLKALACGITLGLIGVSLPLALFSGEDQIEMMVSGWQTIPALALIGSAIAKALLTPLCLEFGWRGGHFFPCIFMGVALGFGIASLSGADPAFCAGVAAGAFLACSTRRPLLSAALLLLCFPPQGALWMLLAALIGGRLPVWGLKTADTSDVRR